VSAIKRSFFTLFLCTILIWAQGQTLAKFADSVRITHHIPELCYAVISSDSVFDFQYSGVRKAGSTLTATDHDRFRIGSNTKAITSFIAATLVRDGHLNWNTKFFDLFPELRRHSDKAYYNISLIDLLSFRVPLVHYTYTDKRPRYKKIENKKNRSAAQARLNFAKWVLCQNPIKEKKEIYFSNPGFCMAGLMLERASGKTYETLVQDLGSALNINFKFGNPNTIDSLQTWGHVVGNIPEAQGDSYKLGWLLPAGNINVTLKDYTKFIQLQLKGFNGKSDLLPAKDFYLIHYGRPIFALGWFCDTSINGHLTSHNLGNPGSFMTSVVVVKDLDRAYIVFANAQNDETNNGIALLLDEMKKRYGY